jgi:short-subunit dehydrogenase
MIDNASQTLSPKLNLVLLIFNRFGVRADYVPADLSKVAEIESLWSHVTTLYPSGVDILINNAG